MGAQKNKGPPPSCSCRSRRGEIKEAKERAERKRKTARPIHQLPRLAAPRTYFLASPRGHVGGGVALCWFYETLKNGPGARSPPLPPSSAILALPLPPLCRPRLRTFLWSRHYSTKSFAVWALDGCPLRGHRRSARPNGLRPNPHAVSRFPPSRRDTRLAL